MQEASDFLWNWQKNCAIGLLVSGSIALARTNHGFQSWGKNKKRKSTHWFYLAFRLLITLKIMWKCNSLFVYRLVHSADCVFLIVSAEPKIETKGGGLQIKKPGNSSTALNIHAQYIQIGDYNTMITYSDRRKTRDYSPPMPAKPSNVDKTKVKQDLGKY